MDTFAYRLYLPS